PRGREESDLPSSRGRSAWSHGGSGRGSLPENLRSVPRAGRTACFFRIASASCSFLEGFEPFVSPGRVLLTVEGDVKDGGEEQAQEKTTKVGLGRSRLGEKPRQPPADAEEEHEEHGPVDSDRAPADGGLSWASQQMCDNAARCFRHAGP